MKVRLQYGHTGLAVDIPSDRVTVIEPRFVEGLTDEAQAFREAVRQPIGSAPLREIVGAGNRVAVVIPDSTRPLPSDRLLPWLFEELGHVPADRFVIVNGTGSHRANTPEELQAMVGEDVLSRYRVVNHDSHDPQTMVEVGRSPEGEVVLMNREYVEADRRIVLGFIEPHFMAGFSGGYKGIYPAVGDIASILRYHDANRIGHPRSTWGVLEGNPTQETIRHNGSLVPLDFCLNVTVNRDRQITRFFCGHPMEAHLEGCAFSRETAMVACEEPFPIVVTTNSGFPLDQNLYQTVKGMSAASQIVAQDGYIATASRCNDGFPEHGNFRRLLFEHDSPRALLDTIETPGFSMFDQWEAQLLALIQLRARVGLQSEIPPDDVRRAHIEPIEDVGAAVGRELERVGADAPVAVLPEGPQTIPYVAS
ncbi:MAG: nickel-dependent lactate racemase [Acidobacteria bacterium]|jgi:nickel-dependent lactate racemase|nr:nickel-dependent lactate racemase [Acidobacteriota bacterium]